MNNYIEEVNTLLKPKNNNGHNKVVLDLFAGCGGLALGFEAMGFKTIGFEMNEDACNTYKLNLAGECYKEVLTEKSEYPPADIIIGGPPCQPFSGRGKQLGLLDSRDGFPIFIKAVEKIKPALFIFENVRGLFYKNKWYLEQIIESLESLGYVLDYSILNASEYFVPQRRERLFVVGHLGDFKFPPKNEVKITAGDALGEMIFQAPENSNFLTPSMDEYIMKYEIASYCRRPRDLHLNETARTLTCRNIAAPTSDMMRIKLPDGKRRRLFPREAARLQSFPDWFEFTGDENSIFYQIGNAVPPMLSYFVAKSVAEYFNNARPIYERGLRNKQYRLFEAEMKKYKSTKLEWNKSKELSKLMNDCVKIFEDLHLPVETITTRRLERMILVFLAVIGRHTKNGWSDIKDINDGISLKTRDIITTLNEKYEENISSGSYDDIRRKDLKLLVLSKIIIQTNPTKARNDSTRGYALAPEYKELIKFYETAKWSKKVDDFFIKHEKLDEAMYNKRDLSIVPIKISPELILSLSAGQHNVLQRKIIEEFLPRFGNGAEVLYVGDTANKYLHINRKKLKELKFFELSHGELPDILAYSEEKNWLFLIEAVHSSGPINSTRHLELSKLTRNCTAEIIYTTAFLERDTFRKFIKDIAWETEVWIADSPDHLIHFDGEKFLGPYKKKT